MAQALDERIRSMVRDIESRDQHLANELQNKRSDALTEERAKEVSPMLADAGDFRESVFTDSALEAVILPVGRPVLTIVHNEAQLTFTDVESEVWRQRLTNVGGMLAGVVPSVGRVEIQNHPQLNWAGTGWFVDEDIIVTNRHVADFFGRNSAAGFEFRKNSLGVQMSSSIDLLQEEGNSSTWVFKVLKILHIEPEPGPDIAFLQVVRSNGAPPAPLTLSTVAANNFSDVAVIGYPAKDSRMPDVELMERLFGNVYNKKRLAPGQITNVTSDKIFHDCSTLGGCSGAAVVELDSGKIAGLHFAGRFLETNFAVPAAVVAEQLHKVKSGSGLRPVITDKTPQKNTSSTSTSTSTSTTSVTLQSNQPAGMPNNQNTFTIPLTITITVGQAVASGQPIVNVQAGTARTQEDIDNDELITEARAEDFDDRKGYQSDFLGDGLDVPLPEANTERKKNDVLTYDNKGQQDHVLRYEHFSVVMSKARRMCIFSAVNINGRTAKGGIARVPWRTDPRIPKEAQIIKECYGNPPKFSRGHMTRREDPVWGTETARMRGNADSMVVTNVTPQMQSFNAPVWLALEDYALGHARDDKMRISVFTGPVFKPADPVRFGVKIPVQFWKIIAFIHDETGKLCATGYKMTQQDHLPEEEFVFGEFETAQLPIRKIEKLTGLSFGNLAAHDPLNDDTESFEGVLKPDRALTTLGEVKFI